MVGVGSVCDFCWFSTNSLFKKQGFCINVLFRRIYIMYIYLFIYKDFFIKKGASNNTRNTHTISNCSHTIVKRKENRT